MATDSGVLTFVNDTGDPLIFDNQQGDALSFVNEYEGNITVLTAGRLYVRRTIGT